MNYKSIKINYKYISEDSNFKLPKAAVVDKSLPGCGLTTFVLSSGEDLILAEPTIALVDNKCAQSIPGQTIIRYSEVTRRKKNPEQGVREGCCKIVTTFDSLEKLEKYFQKGWRIVIDEYQDLFTRFLLKRDTYSKVLDLLERYKSQVTFISATTIPEKYEPNWVANLDHYKLEFPEKYSGVVVPILLKTTDPAKRFVREVLNPILEEGKVTLGDKTFSKCIVFVNSLRSISKMTKDLDKSKYAVMCSETLKNDRYLAKKQMPRFIQSVNNLHNLPDFLFITGVGFEGLDLYSSEHMNVVVSFPTNLYRSDDMEDSKNYSLLSLDIDLIQVLARNRNLDSPYRDRFVFIYNSSIIDGALDSELTRIREAKEELASRYADVTGTYCKEVVVQGYNLFIKDSDGVYRNNKLGLDYSEYMIQDVAQRYSDGKFEILMDCLKAFREPELTWEYIRDKYMKLHELGISDVWTPREKNSKYFKLILRCRNFGLEIPKEFPQVTKKIERKVTRESKKQPIPEVATELKKSLGIPGRYTKPQIKETFEKIYKRLKLNKKAFCSDIVLYAETKNITSKKKGKFINEVSVVSWKH